MKGVTFMKTKRLSALLLAFVLCIGMLFVLAACDQGEPELPKITGVTFRSASFEYDGSPKTIEVQGLPEGASVSYAPANTYTDPGTYPIKATVKLEGYADLELSARLIITDPEATNIATVNFDLAGATLISGETQVTLEKGFSVNAPNNLVKNGYALEGWYNGTEKWDFAEPVTEDMTLVANWVAVEYSITYVIDAADYAFAELPRDPDTNELINPIKFTVESEDIVLAEATITDDTVALSFAGWYIKMGGGEAKVESIKAGTSMDITLYARFKDRDYNVTYDTDGGVNNDGNILIFDKNTPEFTLLPATKEHYDFAGWVDAENNPVTSIAGGNIGDIELKATYTPKAYDIVYELNGGVNNDGNPATYDIETALTFLAPTKEGFEFIGWFTENDLTSTQVEGIELGTTGTVTVYALWQAFPFTISFNPMGGTLPEGNPTGYASSLGIESFEPATRKGYTFVGWYNFADDTLVTYIPVGTEGNFELYAKFIPGTDGLEFNRDGDHYTVIGYEGTETEVVIPETYEGLPVIGIDPSAFENSAITKITLPSTLEFIEEGAFKGCSALASIVIPESVTAIEADAFAGCTALEVINCKAASKPADFSASFNKLNETEFIEVVYGYTSDEDIVMPPQPLV